MTIGGLFPWGKVTDSWTGPVNSAEIHDEWSSASTAPMPIWRAHRPDTDSRSYFQQCMSLLPKPVIIFLSWLLQIGDRHQWRNLLFFVECADCKLQVTLCFKFITLTFRAYYIYVIKLSLLESNTVYSIHIFSESTEERRSIIIYIRRQSCTKMLTVICQKLTSHFLFTAVDKISVEFNNY